MSEELNALLKKIQQDGIQKAEGERLAIIAKAKEEAKTIIENAKTEAEKTQKAAEVEITALQEKAKAAIQQAARDAVLSLREALERKLRNVTNSLIGTALTPEEMGKIINNLAQKYDVSSADGMNVEVPANELNNPEFSNRLIAALREDIRKNATIEGVRGFVSGFKIGFSQTEAYLDFSNEALSDVICEFVGPKLAELIRK